MENNKYTIAFSLFWFASLLILLLIALGTRSVILSLVWFGLSYLIYKSLKSVAKPRNPDTINPTVDSKEKYKVLVFGVFFLILITDIMSYIAYSYFVPGDPTFGHLGALGLAFFVAFIDVLLYLVVSVSLNSSRNKNKK